MNSVKGNGVVCVKRGAYVLIFSAMEQIDPYAAETRYDAWC